MAKADPPASIGHAEALKAAHDRARAVLGQVQLPLRRDVWRGLPGNFLGAGQGSSIEFLDHRQYQAGDDPRHINWQAYARTNDYTLKLFREEVAPGIDIAVDLSPSMFNGEAKARRTAELLYFLVETAAAGDAHWRLFHARVGSPERLPVEKVFAHRWVPEGEPSAGEAPPAWERIPWRARAARIWLTDCLYPANPWQVIPVAASGPQRLLIFCPADPDEADPPWSGFVELRDCETRRKATAQGTPSFLYEYRRNYQRHFNDWREAASARGARFARIDTRAPLLDALLAEPLDRGLVDIAL